jgi:huntingtin interacting protein 1
MLHYKIQLRSNPIICWKFCYTFHKLLRDGHPNVVGESFKFGKELDDLAKLWVHLRQDYGEMIHHYCELLIYKLKFHKKNQAILGNLVLTDKELHLVTADDINN